MTAIDSTADTTLDEEQQSTNFDALVRRLNHQSVVKHFDAYADVAWDDHPIDPTDPRWELGADDALGKTEWYQSLPAETRARMGLDAIVAKMQVGYFFEGVLKRGLLSFMQRLPAGSPELRYAYHEVIEEAQHSLMFQEFVARAGHGGTTPRVPLRAKVGSEAVVGMARAFPELFFIFVLGGEDPIDHLQREVLRRKDGRELHPLLERIMRIHVTEEARHLSFARRWLERNVPKLDPVRRTILAFAAPGILGEMGGMMMQPSPALVKKYQIPPAVLREAYDDNPQYRNLAVDALRKVRGLCRQLGLVTPVTKRVWQRNRIWSED